MRLFCAIGWHRAIPHDRWNRGYYFSKCRGCGRDLVRTAEGRWHVPRGYRVVWKLHASESQPMGDPSSSPLVASLENPLRSPSTFVSASVTPAVVADRAPDERGLHPGPSGKPAEPMALQSDADAPAFIDAAEIGGAQQAEQVLPSMSDASESVAPPVFRNFGEDEAGDFMADDIRDMSIPGPLVPPTSLPIDSWDDFMDGDDGMAWSGPRPVHVALPDFGEDFMSDREDDHLDRPLPANVEGQRQIPAVAVEPEAAMPMLDEAETGLKTKKAKRGRKKIGES